MGRCSSEVAGVRVAGSGAGLRCSDTQWPTPFKFGSLVHIINCSGGQDFFFGNSTS